MNLWWFYTQQSKCSFNELTSRSSIAFGWSEIGALNRYIKNRPNWERQFKTFIQVKGDIAYSDDSLWKNTYREMEHVPNQFWQLLQIKKGDLIICIESGDLNAMRTPTIAGIAQANSDAIENYQFEPEYQHSHSICSGLEWIKWGKNLSSGIPLPKDRFLILKEDNTYLRQAHDAWLELHENLIQSRA